MIFQVTGRPENYGEKEFVLKGEIYRTCLCSDALRKHLEQEGKRAKLTIFVPESLPINSSLDDVNRTIREKGIQNFESVVIPSVGKYSQKGGEFRGSIEAITTAIFLHFLKNRPDEFYIDISTGFNVYPVSLLEAAKRYLTYRKLEGMLQEKSDFKAYILFSPPIMRDSHSLGDIDRYYAEIQPFDVKAFFSLPRPEIDKIASGKQKEKLAELNKKGHELKNKFRSMFGELKLAYNAIRFNVPLAFYEMLEFTVAVDEMEREIIAFVEGFLEPIKEGDVVERLKIDGVNIANIFYTLALYRSIKEFAESLSEPELGEIKEKFSSLYRVKNMGVGVNEYFLLREVEEIRGKAEKIGDGAELILGKLIHGEEFKETSGISKRNFFAHSGFLQNWTVVKKEKGKIYLRWVEDAKKEIKNWLLEPEK
jgi:CRISPR-associated protein Csx1